MAQDIVINGQTYENIESVNMINSNGETIMYYPDAVRYNEQNLTQSQQTQALKNLGIDTNAKTGTLSIITNQAFSGDGPSVGFDSIKYVKVGKLVLYTLSCYIQLNSTVGAGSGISIIFPDSMPISNNTYHATIGLPCTAISNISGAAIESGTRQLKLFDSSGFSASFTSGASGLGWFSASGFYCTDN